jgi:hypothetical protein
MGLLPFALPHALHRAKFRGKSEGVEPNHFIRELREIARLNARAAAAQFIASNCAVVLWLIGA